MSNATVETDRINASFPYVMAPPPPPPLITLEAASEANSADAKALRDLDERSGESYILRGRVLNLTGSTVSSGELSLDLQYDRAALSVKPLVASLTGVNLPAFRRQRLRLLAINATPRAEIGRPYRLVFSLVDRAGRRSNPVTIPVVVRRRRFTPGKLLIGAAALAGALALLRARRAKSEDDER